MMRIACIAVAIAVVGCTPAPSALDFAVRSFQGDEPFRGVDAIYAVLEQDGVSVQGTERWFSADAARVDLGVLPFGERLAIRIEAWSGGIVSARGRSFPFDYPSVDQAPIHAPDVLIGRLGRFADPGTGPFSSEVVAALSSEFGAFLATAEGDLFSYDAHRDAGSNVLAMIGSSSELAGAQWTMIGGELVAFGGGANHVTWMDYEGGVVDRISLPVPVHVVAALPEGTSALVLGGEGRCDVFRIGIEGNALVATELPPLPGVMCGASVIGLRTRVGDRVLALSGAHAALIDPAGEEVTTPTNLGAELELAERTMLALENGLVLLVGGRTAVGMVSDLVTLLVVRPGETPAIEPLSPPPQRLFRARAGAAAARFGPGLVLLAGGRDTMGESLVVAEILELRLDFLPGDVVPTGTLPRAMQSPSAVTLADHTVLVAGREGLAVYFPPRGE